MTNSKTCIFVVEDDEIDVMVIRRTLNKANITNPVYVAKDGIEALEKLRSGEIPSPYIILMDLNLPRMNGIDCIKEIRADKSLKQSVIFVLSTSKDEKEMRKAYNCNIAGYIVKSDIGDEFEETIQMLDQYLNVVELLNL